MSTLTKRYNNSVNLLNTQGIASKQIVNNNHKLISQMSANHPLLLSRSMDYSTRYQPPLALHEIVGQRRQIDSAAASFLELNASPLTVKQQLQEAISHPDTDYGRYVQAILQKQFAASTASAEQTNQAKRKNTNKGDDIQPAGELAQLDLTLPIQRPVQLTGDTQVMQQMRLPNQPDYYSQKGGPATIMNPNVPDALYYASMNDGKRARIGGYTTGQRVFTGDSVETHLSHVPVNSRVPVAMNQPFVSNRNVAMGTTAPQGIQYESAFGPNEPSY